MAYGDMYPKRMPLGYQNNNPYNDKVAQQIKSVLMKFATQREITPYNIRDARMSMQSVLWRQFSVRDFIRLLTNPFYCGVLTHNGNFYKGTHKQMISVEQFVNILRNVFDYYLREYIYTGRKTIQYMYCFSMFDTNTCRTVLGETGKRLTDKQINELRDALEEIIHRILDEGAK
ncbi:MAG: recombinase family protein [Alphaproteobacteria bacterium]|nr:recombinase family protein [Alphaproteobacteria bacterium]